MLSESATCIGQRFLGHMWQRLSGPCGVFLLAMCLKARGLFWYLFEGHLFLWGPPRLKCDVAFGTRALV